MTNININPIKLFYPPYGGNNFYLLAPAGRKYSEGNEFFTREDRAASGKLRRDITASKKTFTLAYDMIDGAVLDAYKSIIDSYSDMELRLEILNGAGLAESYWVLIDAVSYTREASMGSPLWSGVSVTFREV